MKSGYVASINWCNSSHSLGLSWISSSLWILIYIDELCRLIKKEELYDKIEYENWKVNVDIGPYYPKVKGVISNGEKYVKSVPNDSNVDNLLCLPKV